MPAVRNFFLITLPVTAAALMAAEIFLRLRFPVRDPFEQFKNRYESSYIVSRHAPNLRLQLHSNEGLRGIDSSMQFSTNNLGFRGDSLIMPKPAQEFRIFIIGGSTAECFYLDDKKSLGYVLQDSLSFPGKIVKVYNSGRSGDASPDHLAILSQRIVHLQPDLVIVFAGLNDLAKSIVRIDYENMKPLRQYSPPYLYLAATDLQIFRRVYYAVKRTSFEELQRSIPLETDYKKRFDLQQQQIRSDSTPHTDASLYARNLRSMAGLCTANGIPLLLMTNQTTWNSAIDSTARKAHWMLGFQRITYAEEKLDKSLSVFNDSMRAIASGKQLLLYDLADSIPKSMEYFYDDCHFNNAGARFAARGLAAMIRASRQSGYK